MVSDSLHYIADDGFTLLAKLKPDENPFIYRVDEPYHIGNVDEVIEKNC